MVKYLYKSIRSTTFDELDAPQRGAWVYVEAPSPAEIVELTKRFKLEPGYIEDALDEDEQPRLEREGNQSYIFVRFAYRKSSGEVETAPLLLMFDAEHVLTVSQFHLPALDWLKQGKVEFATTQRAKLTLLILTHISDQYDIFIGQTTRKIKTIRTRLRNQGITNQDLIDFVTIEDELNEFLASLLPTNATLRRLLVGRHIPLFDEDQDIVEDLLLNNEQSIEEIRSNLRSINNIRTAYSAISTNNLNRTITLLTIATVLIALPNVFFGMFGMNVQIPLQEEPWAFGAIVGFNLLIICFVILVARKKHII